MVVVLPRRVLPLLWRRCRGGGAAAVVLPMLLTWRRCRGCGAAAVVLPLW